MAQLTLLRAGALRDEQLERWSQLQLAHRGLASPFFRPELALAAAAVGREVHVGVVEEDGAAVGFFPFERRAGAVGRGVGGPFSDYHGLVADPDAPWDATWLVRGCGLRGWEFDHVPAEQRLFAAAATGCEDSPYLDLSAGFAAYEADRRAAGTQVLAQVARAARRLERERGALTFTAEDADADALRRVLGWKSAQYRRTGMVDLFAARSHVALFERLLGERGPYFAGTLSTLRAGDALVAAHFGLRSRDSWHWWIPAYDPAFARFKPGLVLLVELARHAAAAGVGTLDLGRGGEDYKRRLASGAFPLLAGTISVSRAVAVRRQLRARADGAAGRSAAVATAIRAARSLKLRIVDARARR